VTRWDGESTKPHPVTGEQVPDEDKRIPLYRYRNPRKAEWPQADYVVGNPPFVGNKMMRMALGDGYTEALREAYQGLPRTCDFVMYWWEVAARYVRAGAIRRFGFITTNSITQTFDRSVVEPHLSAPDGLSVVFAVPDHPWVDAGDGADVRIAMTVAEAGAGQPGQVLRVATERESASEARELSFRTATGLIHANLAVGANVGSAVPLRSNAGTSFQGVNLVGKGFRLSRSEVLELGWDPEELPPVVRPYMNARDLAQTSEDRFVIDLYGLTAEEARDQYPSLYQRLLVRVKPERDQNNRESRRRNWWLFGEPVGKLRKALEGVGRYIITPETARHRFFVFAPLALCPDHKLYAICCDDAYVLGSLSSSLHQVWALAAGGHLGVGNDPTYNNTRCFDPFPFPACTEGQRARIRELGEALDAHRKRQQALHPGLTLTNMYNVLAKLRSGEALTAREKVTHELGLCS